MTNREYCLTLYREDLALICKVAGKYVDHRCDRYATAVEKEKVFNEWYEQEYDPDEWARCRRIPQVNLYEFGTRQVRVGCVKEALLKVSPIH